MKKSKTSQVHRRATYRLYPSKAQAAVLENMRVLHQQLYNACLEERISAYKQEKTHISYVEQARSITIIRSEHPEYEALNAQSLQVTAKRLDEAFDHFFRRIKEGARKCGFPRFKSRLRYKGFGYKTHNDGWKLFSGKDKTHRLRVSGVGTMRIRGESRHQTGKPKTLSIMLKQGKWYASVVFDVASVQTHLRKRGSKAIGIDWGLEHFATIVDGHGDVTTIDNPRFLKRRIDDLRKAQVDFSRKKRGSKRRDIARKKVARIHADVSNTRKDFLHQTSSALISQCALISTELLNVSGMTSHGGAYKKGLNREILSTSPGMFFQMLSYKAEEAGVMYMKAQTRTLKPSQRCHKCQNVRKKSLAERIHVCDCGAACSRDANAAAVLLSWGMAQLVPPKRQELALREDVVLVRCDKYASLKRETPPISPQAIGWM